MANLAKSHLIAMSVQDFDAAALPRDLIGERSPIAGVERVAGIYDRLTLRY
jgi:hypothetical protein